MSAPAGIVPATLDEAVQAAQAQAWDDDGRKIIHAVSIGGGIFLGADWHLESVLTELRQAVEIAWFPDPMGHELAVKTAGGRYYKFSVKRPLSPDVEQDR